MSIPSIAECSFRVVWVALICLVLISCTSTQDSVHTLRTDGIWSGRPVGAPPSPRPSLKRAIIAKAVQEWRYFDSQTIVFKGNEESIPHVGHWEDDDQRYSRRVNSYWRAVDKPGLTGMDCNKPWSAAFISWVMQSSGVPDSQFRRSQAHWTYLASAIENASLPGRYFVPRRISDYSPKPGDLICAYRSPSRVVTIDGYTTASMLYGISAHCDLVVAKTGQTLDVIGGNVRNSVSRSSLELDAQGHLQRLSRRPWFLILDNRL